MTMFINAYATVRDEIPGPYSHQRGTDDPELAPHLQGFSGFVWDRGGQEMTPSMWGLLRHLGETRRQYVFERDSIEGLREWAERANSVILLTDGRVVNPEGKDIVAGGAVPYHPASWERAQRVRAGIMKTSGQSVPAHYPPVRSEFEAVVREPAEVARRLVTLIAVSELAGFMVEGQEPPFDALRSVLPDAFSSWSSREARFVELLHSGAVDYGTDFMNPAAVAVANEATQEASYLARQLVWASDAAVMLAYALGLQDLPEGVVVTNTQPVVAMVGAYGQRGVYERATALIALPELCEKYEFVRCMRWIAVDEQLNQGQPSVIDPNSAGTLLEWHRALAWLFTPGADWDEVDLST